MPLPFGISRRTLLKAGSLLLSGGPLWAYASQKRSALSPDCTAHPAAAPSEPILEPNLPIVDAHHHLWFLTESVLANLNEIDSPFDHALAQVYRDKAHYLLEEFLRDAASGHNIVASVFIECDSMYRRSGPPQTRSAGEVEFANGMAAMAASGTYGDVQACAGIVGAGAVLGLGTEAEEALVAQIKAGNGRYRGVRVRLAHDADPNVLGRDVAYVSVDAKFRAGVKRLQRLGLPLGIWALEPQLPQVIDIAREFPATPIVLDHLATPLGVGRFQGRRMERFPAWRANMKALARCENASVKLGGLGLPLCGFRSFMATPRLSSSDLAIEWKPYIETAIEIFGAPRCMFESNFPVDSGACSYSVLWNTFKRLTAGASAGEKKDLFAGTAKRVYRLTLDAQV
jgi:L-fuconolactonase